MKHPRLNSKVLLLVKLVSKVDEGTKLIKAAWGWIDKGTELIKAVSGWIDKETEFNISWQNLKPEEQIEKYMLKQLGSVK